MIRGEEQVLPSEQSGEILPTSVETSEEKPIEYPKLSEDSYEIDEENKIIAFAPDSGIMSFALSDNPDGPTEEDKWYNVNEEKEIEILDTEVRKKYVYYKASNYTITFNADGGSVSPATQTVTYGTTYTNLPTPTKKGYTFKGWYANFTGNNNYINYRNNL